MKKVHILDTGEIDELDEISGDEQLALTWCTTCKKWERHWLNRDMIGSGAYIERVAA